ncbi:hypothetical protein ACHQM5_018624 [Ranunculus cassubicifolius]
MDVGIQNWADLPSDVLHLIFAKIGSSEILLTAQFVCSAWSNLSTEPRLFRSLDLRDQFLFHYRYSRSLVICIFTLLCYICIFILSHKKAL